MLINCSKTVVFIFQASYTVYGTMQTHDLKPNGANIPVTNDNRQGKVLELSNSAATFCPLPLLPIAKTKKQLKTNKKNKTKTNKIQNDNNIKNATLLVGSHS